MVFHPGKSGNRPTQFQKGKSGNPSGHPKLANHLRMRCLQAVSDTIIDAWMDEIENKPRVIDVKGVKTHTEARGQYWVKCSEMVAAYGLGKPAQHVVTTTDNPTTGLSYKELIAKAAEIVKEEMRGNGDGSEQKQTEKEDIRQIKFQ